MRWETRNGINNINQLNKVRENNKKLKDKSDENLIISEKINDEIEDFYDGCGIIDYCFLTPCQLGTKDFYKTIKNK